MLIKDYKDVLNDAKLLQEKCNAFVTILEKEEHIESNSLINNVIYTLKDNYNTKDILTTASSNILKNYIPPYDSTVYKKLKESGAILLGKTTLDELAMGGSGITSHTGIVKNPLDTTRIAGGSSSGSACTVASDLVPFSIGSDTGDSVRKPASLCGIVGFKPTYGRISRYGLIPFASSLDTVGIFAKTVKDVSIVTDILKGKDEMDMTSLEDDNINYTDNLVNNLNGVKLFYIKEIVDKTLYKDETTLKLIDLFYKKLEELKSRGAIINEVSLDKNLLESMHITYFIISSAESISNNSNLTGINFSTTAKGNNVKEIMFNSRTNGFGEMIKRRFVIGSYSLERENQEKLFLNAKRVRGMLVSKLNDLFNSYDALILPSYSTIAPKIEDSLNNDIFTKEVNLLDNHLVLGNFGGYPSISIPMFNINNMPIGLSITCKQLDDLKCLNIAYSIENEGGKTC